MDAEARVGLDQRLHAFTRAKRKGERLHDQPGVAVPDDALPKLFVGVEHGTIPFLGGSSKQEIIQVNLGQRILAPIGVQHCIRIGSDRLIGNTIFSAGEIGLLQRLGVVRPGGYGSLGRILEIPTILGGGHGLFDGPQGFPLWSLRWSWTPTGYSRSQEDQRQ